MGAPGYMADEAERLLSLLRTELLESPPEQRFDRITRLAAAFFGVQTCVLSLVDKKRFWTTSRIGQERMELARGISSCGRAILNRATLTIPDARVDARFSSSPLVTGAPHIRFYVGAPLHASGGRPIGTLCLIDSHAQAFSVEQEHVLRDFADMIEREVTSTDQAQYQKALTASAARTTSIINTSPDTVFVIDRQHRFLVCSDHPELIEKQTNLLGLAIEDVLPAPLGPLLINQIELAFSSSEVDYQNYTLPDKQQSFEVRCRKIDEREVLVIIRNTTEQDVLSTEVERLSEVARQTTNGVVITDAEGKVVWLNEAFASITEYSFAEMLGQKPGDLLQGVDTATDAIQTMGKAIACHERFNVDVLNYSKSQNPYWVRIACNPLWGDEGVLNGFIAIESDITKEKRDADLIRSNQSLLSAVIDANTIGTWQLNLQTGELLVNDMWAVLLGYKLSELMPTDRGTWERLTHPDDLVECIALIAKHVTGQILVYEAKIRMKHKSGSWVWINTRGRLTSHTADGMAEWLLGTHSDISAQVIAESTLYEQSKHMQAIVDNMLDGVISLDGKGTVQTYNTAAERIFGYSSEEMIGRNVNRLMGAPHQAHHDSYIANYVSAGVGKVIGRNRELEARRKDGTAFPIELGLAEVQHSGEISFIGIVRDITQRRKDEEDIRRLAFYDSLTGLPNRRLLLDRLQQVMANCARQHRYAALLFLDMDNFKSLNDSAGHNSGDLLLCQVAKRLLKCVRQGDTVSRIGGDEFVIALENLNEEAQLAATQAEVAAAKVITALQRGFDLDGLTYNGSVSIGVTMFNDASSSLEDLLKQADMAMYKAKAAGRNGTQFFDPQMQVAVSLRAAMEQDLHDALQSHQFKLFYQTQVDDQNRIVGVEVLLRWLHPIKGMISPAQFIPLAEETGLIVPIGEWALGEACRTLALWAKDPAKAELSIAVNISVVQFSRNDIVKTVLDSLSSAGASPHNLKLEITESLLASNFEDVKTKMLALQSHGVQFSIDDFGTGYSSLFYLKQLPINQLKIDQSFVSEITSSLNDQAIAQAIVTLAQAMHMNVIAEGVETEEQRALLETLGCVTYQGYLFGKPSALEDLVLQVQ